MSERQGIVAAGNWIVDHTKLIDHYPRQEALGLIGEELRSNGGGPYNLLKDLAKLGASYPLVGVGRIGDDDYGQWIRQDCRKYGIDASRLLADPETPTSYTDVFTVSKDGRRTFFHQPGANARLQEADFHFETLEGRHFHLAYLLLLAQLDGVDSDGRTGASRLLETARAEGFITSIDLVSSEGGNFEGVVAPSLPHTDIYIANELETERLTGLALLEDGILHTDRLHETSELLFERGVHQLVVIHYAGGGAAVSKSGELVLQPAVDFPAERVRGTAGAGDAFAAGLLHGLHEAANLADCLEMAVCVAAASLESPTCSASIPALHECLQLGRSLGYR